MAETLNRFLIAKFMRNIKNEANDSNQVKQQIYPVLMVIAEFPIYIGLLRVIPFC